jgi:Ni/Co efflux regulator RcnB
MQKLKMIALSALTATAFTFAPSIAKADSDHHYSGKKHYSSHYSHNYKNKHKSHNRHKNKHTHKHNYKKKVVYKPVYYGPHTRRVVYYEVPHYRHTYKTPVRHYYRDSGSSLHLSFNFD